MPLYRHECSVCGVEWVELFSIHEPPPEHCGRATTRLVPRHVVARVVPEFRPARSTNQPGGLWDVDGKIAEQGYLPADSDGVTEPAPRNRFVAPLVSDDPEAIPAPPTTGVWAKDYDQCTADERTERWRDTAQAVEAWTRTKLEDRGDAQASAVAHDAAQQIVERGRSQATREDGLT
jgi:hypothetical protein